MIQHGLQKGFHGAPLIGAIGVIFFRSNQK